MEAKRKSWECLFCGAVIAPGESVYMTREGAVHQDCWCDYALNVAKSGGLCELDGEELYGGELYERVF